MANAITRLIIRMLRHVHAGERHLAWFAPGMKAVPDTIMMSSTAFVHGQRLPDRYAAPPFGQSTSPPLAFRGAPARTVELVLIAQDPDAPLPRPVVHAILTAIPPDWTSLTEGALSDPAPARCGRISFGKLGYAGPRPPPGHGPHRYVFQIFALDSPLVFDAPPGLKAVLAAMRGHVLARGQLVGRYEAS